MKKILILALLFVPVISFGAPAVRMLGGGTKTTAAAGATSSTAGAKVTPVRAAATPSNMNVGRVGALRAKTNTTNTTGAITSASSRFPVIAPVKSYAGISTPTTGSGTGSVTPSTANVDTDAIVSAVMNQIQNNYYQKIENKTFVEAVRDVTKDDPRIDAIRRSNPIYAHPGETLDDDFVYIWVETGN